MRTLSRGRSIADLEIYFTIQTIAATYLAAGLSKLIETKGAWLAQLPNITVQLLKTNDQAYYDQLVHTGSTWVHEAMALLTAHPWLTFVLFAPGLVVELTAWLALAGKRMALMTGLLLLGLHMMIHLFMNILFVTNVCLIAIFLVNLPYWMVSLGKHLPFRLPRAPGGLPASQ